MNNECEFAGKKYCMCEACMSMRKMIEDMKDMDTEKYFEEAGKLLKEIQQVETENK